MSDLTTKAAETRAGLVADWRKAMEGVTPGEWQSIEALPRSVYTSEDPDVRMIARTDVLGSPTSEANATAAWIARCSPAGISDLLALIEQQAAELAEARAEVARLECEHHRRGVSIVGMSEHAGAHLCRAEKAEEERDALLQAIGFKPGALGDELRRKVILDDAAGMRPAMVEARREARRTQGDADLWSMRMLEEWPGDTLLLRLWRQRKQASARALAAEAEPDALKAKLEMAGEALEGEFAKALPDIVPAVEDWLFNGASDQDAARAIAAAIRAQGEP